jgi:hypothetical protein
VVLSTIPTRDRIILNAPDGIAIAVLGNPALALDISLRWLTVSAAGVPIAVAINHGAIRLAPDETGQQGLIGDAVGTAAAIAHFAGAARLFVSRSFRDALAEAAPARAVGLRPAGVFTDANVRTHELLAPEPSAVVRRRRILAAVGMLAMVAIGIAVVIYRPDIRREIHGGKPAVLAFELYPDAEVMVDRIARGKSPPLRQLSLEPGPHTVEVRRKSYPPFRTVVELEPGRTSTVEISFAPGEDHSFFHRLRSWFGG